MDPRLRTAVTLVVLLVLVAVGATWGWDRLTSPVEETAAPGICTDTDLEQGDRVRTEQVVVSVINAGDQAGLAGRTMAGLVDRGFVEGSLDNAPDGTNVGRVQIWTENPRGADVRLVRTHLGRRATTIVRRDPVADGVNVVVGDNFNDLSDGRNRVRVRREASICLATQ